MIFALGHEHHTFTIISRCPRTLQLGIGMATYSLAVGGYCPYIKSNVAALSTQAYANPQLGPLAMGLLEMGCSPENVFKELEGHDPYMEYRQLGIVDKDGTAAARTGSKTRPWAGHIVGNGFLTMGNVLTGQHVTKAMATAFEESIDHDLGERLLRAVEAGRDAGGQPQGQRSAALIVYEAEDYPLMDLRVDAHEEPIGELRRVHTAYIPYIPLYYHLRAKEPHKTPSQEEWIKQYQQQQ